MESAGVSLAKDSHSEKRIAVVGMAVQYAGCRDKEEFWETLMRKESNASRISDLRLGSKYREVHYRPERSKYADTFCNERYGCVDEAVDNEHEMLLKLARQAIADAREMRQDGKGFEEENFKRAGIVSGCLSFPMDNLQGELLNIYQNHVEKKLGPRVFEDASLWSERKAAQDPDAGDRKVFLDPASFVAEELGLGPLHYCVDAACASALYVLRLAQDHLVSGAADLMLCGATCLPEPFFILSGFSTFQAMPVGENGVSMPLQKESQGLTPGEGGAIMILKRLEDAVRDGDHIYGTLLGATISNAGCGLPLSPHFESEESCLKETYVRIEKDPKSVQYVECHATGTPQGDKVEIDALKSCFDGCVPRFGSTKGNFGHTLVAAGFAGMCKVLLSMERGFIPPTPGVDDINKMDDLVVTEAIPWPETTSDVKRAGLSAFGFGGTNAHAVFEEFRPASLSERRLVRSMSDRYGRGNMKIAITGMDATFGTLKGLDAFERAIYNGDDAARPLPEKRWRFLGNDEEFLSLCGLKKRPHGCYLEDVDVDFKRLRTPMTPEDILRPQQLLAVSTIDRAVTDAGLEKGGKVAVLVGLGTDLELYRHRARVALKERVRKETSEYLDGMMKYINDCGTSTSYTSYIGNLVATRVSSLWGFTGPSFTVTEGNNSVYRCAEIGKYLLETGEVDAVVVAGVDMCGSAENMYLKSRRFQISSQSHPRASFDAKSDGYFAGEGCGALVLRRQLDCQPQERIYACIDAIVSGNTPEESLSAALQESHKVGGDVELLEVTGDSETYRKHPNVLEQHLTVEHEIEHVTPVLASDADRHKIAVSSVKANVGDVGYASGAASLIKTALCLYNRYLPANAHLEDPREEMKWHDALFTCQRSRAWLKNPGCPRRAAISAVSETRSCYSVLLSDENAHHEIENRISLDDSESKIIVIRGDTPEAILQRLDAELVPFLQPTGSGNSPKKMARIADDVFHRLLGETILDEQKPASKLPKLALCLVTTPKQLQKELELAAKGIPRCVKAKRDWASPWGSRFAPEPVASDRIAFMYGEGRSPYYGIGVDLHRIWPGLHEEVNRKTVQLWDEGDRWFMPRASSIKELESQKIAFDRNQIEMFRLGVFFSMCFTDFAREKLNLKPKAAFGLSLGEISMLFALSEKNTMLSQEMTKRLRSSEVWASALAVNFDALRKEWGIASSIPVEEFWQGYLVYGSRSSIEDAIGRDNRFVRLLIVNDSKSALIAGKPEECKKVLAKLKAQSPMPAIPVSQGMVGHCPEVLPFVDQIGHIHEMLEIPNRTDCDLYTSVTNTKLAPKSSSKEKVYCPDIREFVGQLYSKIADFPAVVQAVQKDNYDVFVEMGPSNFRSLAVRTILGPNVKHVTAAIDRQNESAWSQMLRMTATLQTHRVPGVQIRELYHSKLVQTSVERYRNFLTKETVKPNKFLRTVVINGFFDDSRDLLPLEVENKLQPADPPVTEAIQQRKMKKPLPNFPIRKRVARSRPVLSKDKQEQQTTEEPIDMEQLKEKLLDLRRGFYVREKDLATVDISSSFAGKDFVFVPPCSFADLGDQGFLQTYGVLYPLYTGAMAKGIASADLVIAAGKRGILASFGAGGLPMKAVRESVEKIQAALPSGPYAVNLIHSPFDSNLEQGNVDLFLEKGVRVVEASAFTTLTLQVVRYRVAGLSRKLDGSIDVRNRLIAKISRTELAEMFLKPAPETLLTKLLKSGDINREQLELAKQVPMADDITVEADSGGHTDNRPIHVILPLIVRLRNRLHKECGFPAKYRVRVGVGGGIGCSEAALAAFNMGAAFVVTGTVNQLCRESGTSDNVRKQLCKASYSDVCMAPAADMFEEGVKLQILKKGTMFPSRANKLYELFCKYDSFGNMPTEELDRVEKRIFRKSLDEVWKETQDFYINRLQNPAKIEKANRDGKLKMSLCFRWYLGLASFWANSGQQDRVMDYQIWCGPAIGSFNDFADGTLLDAKATEKYPSVVQVNLHILRGACYLRRVSHLRNQLKSSLCVSTYKPDIVL